MADVNAKPVGQAPTVVQFHSTQHTGTPVSYVLSGVTPGNTIVVGFVNAYNLCSITSCTANGAAMTKAANSPGTSLNVPSRSWIYYLQNSPGGSVTVTVDFNGAAIGFLYVAEITPSGGIDVDAVAGDTADSTHVDSPSLVTTFGNDLMFALVGANCPILSVGTGWNDGGNAQSAADIGTDMAYKAQSATGTYATDMTKQFGGYWSGAAAAFTAPVPGVVASAGSVTVSTSAGDANVSVTGSALTAIRGTALAQVAGRDISESGLWSMGYYQPFLNPVQTPAQLEWSALTHVFAVAKVIRSDGTLDATPEEGLGYFDTLVAAAHANGKKVLVTFQAPAGDSTSVAAAVSGHLSTLVANMVAAMNAHGGFDGIDLDIEPLPSYATMSALAPALRTAIGVSKLLTAAVAYNGQDVFTPLASYFDAVAVMTYGLYGGYWYPYNWHCSALYSPAGVEVQSIDLVCGRWLAAGFPANKLCMGFAFFGGRGIGGQRADLPTEGATAPYQVMQVQETWQEVRYKTLYLNGEITPSYRHWDGLAQVPYLSEDFPSSANDQFITYDDEESLAAKVRYVRAHSLRGWIIWELTGDYLGAGHSPDQPLLVALKETALEETVVLVSGSQATGTAGTVTIGNTVSVNVSLSGASASAAAGSVSVASPDVVVTPSGVSASASAGSLAMGGDMNLTLSGASATTATGEVDVLASEVQPLPPGAFPVDADFVVVRSAEPHLLRRRLASGVESIRQKSTGQRIWNLTFGNRPLSEFEAVEAFRRKMDGRYFPFLDRTTGDTVNVTFASEPRFTERHTSQHDWSVELLEWL